MDQAIHSHPYTGVINDDNNTGTFSLSESEWMCRTPSPSKENLTDRLWTPTPDKKERHKVLSPQRMAEMMEADGLRMQKTATGKRSSVWNVESGLDEDMAKLHAVHNNHSNRNPNDDVQVNEMNLREGNWI